MAEAAAVSDTAQPALVCEDVHKSFGPLEVLKGVSLTANEGDVIAMLGSSGSGKSTFLRCINLLEVPDSGRVTSRSTASARAWAWCSNSSISGPT